MNPSSSIAQTVRQTYCAWFNQFQHPYFIADWAFSPNIIRMTSPQSIDVCVPFASVSATQALSDWLNVTPQPQQPALKIQIQVVPQALVTLTAAPVQGIKNIIAVTSAKGGVGKSTTAVNLALALSQGQGKVGLLDADIYGPSLPTMLGTSGQPLEIVDNKWMKPIQSHGLWTHSIGYLVAQEDAAIWRGPMASKALNQLLRETQWPDLDYLVVDMPPGTGDIQLTLAQQIPVTGAVVVTTPQDLALADARKGIAMFEKVHVPVVGLIENMSYYECSRCGHQDAIFGTGGAEKLAQHYNLPLLGQIPLHIDLRADVDAGHPTVVSRPDSSYADQYRHIADRVASHLYWQGQVKPDLIPCQFLDDGDVSP